MTTRVTMTLTRRVARVADTAVHPGADPLPVNADGRTSMTTNDTRSLLAQRRTVLDLTNTKIQFAETRGTQAHTEAVRRELSQNAADRPGAGRSHRGPHSANSAGFPM